MNSCNVKVTVSVDFFASAERNITPPQKKTQNLYSKYYISKHLLSFYMTEFFLATQKDTFCFGSLGFPNPAFPTSQNVIPPGFCRKIQAGHMARE